ncbi:hypothetical protein MNBD_PLANCTO02-1074 [hydrothermal vent metagenome]|uniref:Cell division inhibitor n=1 Tax=hydrothermal vent metagenome TaxID=652676 RepID=A0A3B1DIE5_9ZZZZ
MAQFEISIVINCQIDDAFLFLTAPAKVVSISEPGMGLTLISGAEQLAQGDRVEFELTGFGVAQKMVHEITLLERPHRFVEKQLEGPLKSVSHEHLFEEDENGFVTITDRIEFEPPGGMLGFVMTEDFLTRNLRSSFEYRHQKLKEILESNKTT